jgi:hypothetical protein
MDILIALNRMGSFGFSKKLKISSTWVLLLLQALGSGFRHEERNIAESFFLTPTTPDA